MYPTESQNLHSLKRAANFLALVSAELIKYLNSLHICKFCFSIPWKNEFLRPATYSLNRKSPSTPIKHAEILFS